MAWVPAQVRDHWSGPTPQVSRGPVATFLAPYTVSYWAQMRRLLPGSIMPSSLVPNRPSVDLWAISSTERLLQPASHFASVNKEDEPGWWPVFPRTIDTDAFYKVQGLHSPVLDGRGQWESWLLGTFDFWWSECPFLPLIFSPRLEFFTQTQQSPPALSPGLRVIIGILPWVTGAG